MNGIVDQHGDLFGMLCTQSTSQGGQAVGGILSRTPCIECTLRIRKHQGMNGSADVTPTNVVKRCPRVMEGQNLRHGHHIFPRGRVIRVQQTVRSPQHRRSNTALLPLTQLTTAQRNNCHPNGPCYSAFHPCK